MLGLGVGLTFPRSAIFSRGQYRWKLASPEAGVSFLTLAEIYFGIPCSDVFVVRPSTKVPRLFNKVQHLTPLLPCTALWFFGRLPKIETDVSST